MILRLFTKITRRFGKTRSLHRADSECRGIRPQNPAVFPFHFDDRDPDRASAGRKHQLLCPAGKHEKRAACTNGGTVQRDDTSVFCISLKAGGTGLNLTGADIVIHYDPWWNVAVENQATDRAHRIGQKNVVTVYKLIAKRNHRGKNQSSFSR